MKEHRLFALDEIELKAVQTVIADLARTVMALEKKFALRSVFEPPPGMESKRKHKRRMSEAGRMAIARAQKRRWAKLKRK